MFCDNILSTHCVYSVVSDLGIKTGKQNLDMGTFNIGVFVYADTLSCDLLLITMLCSRRSDYFDHLFTFT